MSYYRPTSFGFLPPVVKNIIIINAIMHLGGWVLNETIGLNIYYSLVLHMPDSPEFQLHQIITHMFMHGDFSHLFFNMLGVWMFGSVLEQVWGPKRFLTYYLITGIGAAICQVLILYFQGTPSVLLGASGALFGLLLAYGMLFPNQYIYLYFAIPIKAKYFVMLYGAIELFAGISGSQSGIAHFAHLGGMLFGYLLIKIWGRHNFNQY